MAYAPDQKTKGNAIWWAIKPEVVRQEVQRVGGQAPLREPEPADARAAPQPGGRGAFSEAAATERLNRKEAWKASHPHTSMWKVLKDLEPQHK
jgi:hypothetical protein